MKTQSRKTTEQKIGSRGACKKKCRPAGLLRCCFYDDGLSLVEMLIVIAIAGILMAIATIQFGQWTRKYNIEREIKELYSDLMNARMQAMTKNRTNGIRLVSSTQYTTLDDLNNDGDFNDAGEVSPNLKNLTNQMSWNGNPPANSNLTFNSRGLASSSGTISITNTVGAGYDCITISTTRINMGQMSGGSCVQK